ncbi:DNA repair protein REV1 [Harpegnathos saltator]|uniref:DNA repair protein REV1 n=1 Tax=Harpegnathos saltator TaxID=610380 RepID=E2B6G0_HARSA|nr:DNA repair protein REV1 [Harpegnathos saltator]XP_011151764.1 DNA repair protein REV1 [Harpegnathos saltator]EFN88704.1 DNA repair protein REV1 [Harpegnathos saltator]
MSRKKRDHAWGENGFEDWGGYMAAKKAKLEEQFRDKATKEFKESSKLFEGIAIFVNGYTDPTSDELRHLMMMHGGIYHHYMRPRITTHIIASNLPHSKIVLYRRSQNPIPICKPQWITESIAAGKILNFQNYLLYSNSTNAQPQLAYKLNIKNGKFNIESVTQDKMDAEVSTNTVNNKNSTIDINVLDEGTNNDTRIHDKINIPQSSSARINAQSTRDTEFLSAFYSNSRLHYIATMGTTFKDYVNELRDKSDGTFPELERLTKSRKVRGTSSLAGRESDSEDDTIGFDNSKACNKREFVIMHIDMDCFFVSVGIRKRPELQGLPVAVAHAKGNVHSTSHDGKEEFGSMSEVASCSYAARKAGVKNGMFLGEALKMCPNLKTIQYDFEGYKEVSYALYDTVASYTLSIEAVSCDEMYADCTKVLETSGLSPLEFATVIREKIKRKTGCPVSTGFGSNKLLARLATRKAKPDNQFYLSGRNAEPYIRTLNVRDLPGVGGTTTHKLHEMNVRTCEQLQMVSLGLLQKEFGRKTGEQLHKMCRGLDDTKLNLEHVRKSVSAEVNYGIRFRDNEDAVNFLSKLSTEVCSRLTAARVKGRCVTLKLMIRAKEAPKETAKFMGHGLCNYITKSRNLIASVDDVGIIRKEVVSIWNQLHLTPEDMRGIGIQISRLEICKNKGSLKNFFDKTEKVRTCENTSGDNNKKNQHDSKLSEAHKKNSPETPQTTKSATENASSAKIDNQSSRSAQSFEFEHTAVPLAILQTDPSSLAIEAKNETSHDRKRANKNIIHAAETKDPSGKSSKKTAQKQTSQENFFKHIKPSSGKSSKYEMPPRIQDLDMSVLIELPQDIRNEIFDEYKRSKERSRVDTETAAKNTTPLEEMNTRDEETPKTQESFSQVDPDVLSALMGSDLHPDVRRDVQMYCNMKREAYGVSSKETNKKEGSSDRSVEQSQEAAASSSSEICRDGGDARHKDETKAACGISQDVKPHAENQPCMKDDTEETESAMHRTNRIEISRNNVAMDKADTFILQNLSILHNNENVDKHQEMLINLVNHLFTLPLQQVKMQIQTWVTKSNAVNEVDFLSLATFLSMLPQKKRIADLHILLKTMHRCTTKTGNCIWHRTYRRTVRHVQRYMQIEYNSNLMVPSIGCNDSRCNNGD